MIILLLPPVIYICNVVRNFEIISYMWACIHVQINSIKVIMHGLTQLVMEEVTVLMAVLLQKEAIKGTLL